MYIVRVLHYGVLKFSINPTFFFFFLRTLFLYFSGVFGLLELKSFPLRVYEMLRICSGL